MAMGFSGSNGGISANQKKIPRKDLLYGIFTLKYPYPMIMHFEQVNVRI